MKTTLYILIFTLFPLLANSQTATRTLRIINTENVPISEASATGYSLKMDSIFHVVSNGQGEIVLSNEELKYLLVEHNDYLSKMVFLPDWASNTIQLKDPVKLKEVVVTAQTSEHDFDHDTYRIPQQAMDRYESFYRALNEIPHMIVLSSGQLFYEGESNVKLLLNGMETSRNELAAIAKEDVQKVEVYRNAPGKYAMQGYSSVVNVILKSNLTGGNASLSLMQAFNSLNGNNDFYLFHNYGRSRFSLEYNNENGVSKKNYKEETLKYTYDDVTYEKKKTAFDSHNHYNTNTMVLSFQNNKERSYLYNLKLGGTLNRESERYWQGVDTHDTSLLGRNRLNTQYDKFWLSNYFEKTLGKEGKGGTAMMNVTYEHLNSRYFSAYQEFEDEETADFPLVDVSSSYKININNVLGEALYRSPRFKWGQLRLDIYDTYTHSRYADYANPYSMSSNKFGASVQWFESIGRVTLQAVLGVKNQNITSYAKGEKESSTYWTPSPVLAMVYRPNKKFQSVLRYSFSRFVPSVSQLSETNQWIDTKLVFHGNANLKPYKTHNISARESFNSKYIDASLILNYTYSPNRICNNFQATDEYMLETLVNLNKYYEYVSQWSLTIKPLGSSKWKIFTNINAGKSHGESDDYDWDGYRFQWYISSSVNLNKWNFEGSYQYPGKVSEGQLIRPRAQTWGFSAELRPKRGLTVGAHISKPFGKYFIDSEYTTSHSPVYRKTLNRSKDWVNRVHFIVRWNISYGKRHNEAEPGFGNQTTDTGILKK
jgi:hypothetical protein